MLYCKYKKYVKIFRYVRKLNGSGNFDVVVENKFGSDASEALSILKANGGLYRYDMSNRWAKDNAKIDATILEYEEKSSALLRSFVTWIIGTVIAVLGLYFAYCGFK